MGSHHSHDSKSGGEGNASETSTPRGSQRGAGSRSGSGGDLQGLPDRQDKPPPSMVPVEKLGKLLVQRSQKEDGINGVTEKSFTVSEALVGYLKLLSGGCERIYTSKALAAAEEQKYLFPMYPELAKQFYKYIHRVGKCKNQHISLSTFRLHCEKILTMLDDSVIIDTYVRMFGAETDDNVMMPEGLRQLLYTSYKLSMDHYPEGPQTCLMINKTLTSVVSGCFNNKDCHSVGFVVRWLEEHCHRLIFPVHRYCVHMLATRYRDIEAEVESSGSGAGLELATPVLDRGTWQPGTALLPVSVAWLVGGAAPPLYTRPLQPPPPPPGVGAGAAGGAGGGAGALASALWVSRLVCALPSHWAPLYASRDHGLGANRFLHHTLAYRGPTLVVVQGDGVLVVVCCPTEWRETHQYWGSADSALLQIFPTFSVVERAEKMLYLNTSIRGYPRGLRAGADPRKPLLALADDFDSFTFKGVPYSLQAIEVWGCGDRASRDTQLEIKKWQVREAERQRQVKLSAAEWIEHPDRYLLELAGRPQYNNSAT